MSYKDIHVYHVIIYNLTTIHVSRNNIKLNDNLGALIYDERQICEHDSATLRLYVSKFVDIVCQMILCVHFKLSLLLLSGYTFIIQQDEGFSPELIPFFSWLVQNYHEVCPCFCPSKNRTNIQMLVIVHHIIFHMFA